MLLPAIFFPVFRTNPKRLRDWGQQVFLSLRSVSLTDQERLVGWLLATNRNVGKEKVVMGVLLIVTRSF